MKRFVFALLCLLLTGFAQAAVTYTYTGTPYTNITGPAYTSTMSPSGSFSVSTALPANFSGDISTQLLSYTFTDGVNTYGSSDARMRIEHFVVETDASGTITDTYIELQRWNSAGSTHNVGDPLAVFGLQLTYSDGALNNATCDAIGTGDLCSSVTTYESRAISTPGSWVRSAVSIPTLSEFGMLALALLLMLLALPQARARFPR